LLWGSLLFFGRLKTMSSTYTLFTPGGDPLRAKIKMGFAGFLSTQEEARRAARTSPDMTHIVQFKAGDSLPLLCHRIYDDPTQYAAVAHYNDITNFREIEPGTRIVFPPLR
jgi:nucleoid-associated protein YgaU